MKRREVPELVAIGDRVAEAIRMSLGYDPRAFMRARGRVGHLVTRRRMIFAGLVHDLEGLSVRDTALATGTRSAGTTTARLRDWRHHPIRPDVLPRVELAYTRPDLVRANAEAAA